MACTPKPVRRQLKRARRYGGSVLVNKRGSKTLVVYVNARPVRALARIVPHIKATTASMNSLAAGLARAKAMSDTPRRYYYERVDS